MRFFKLLAVIVVAAVFFAAGIAKFTSAPQVAAVFERFGLPTWFMLVTGAIEVAGAAALLTPWRRLRFLGASLLSVTMLAGAGFHVAFDPPLAAAPAIILALVTGFAAYANLRQGRTRLAPGEPEGQS